MLTGAQLALERVPSRATVLHHLNDMLGAMRDNFEVRSRACLSSLLIVKQSFSVKEAAAKEDYVAFCRQVLKSLKETAGPSVNEHSCPNLRLLAGLAAV